MLKKLKDNVFLSSLKLSFLASWETSKWLLISRIMIQLALAVSPMLTLYIAKYFIDNLVVATQGGSFNNLLLLLGLMFIARVVTNILSKLNMTISTLHQDKIGQYIQVYITKHVNRLDISYFDNPDFYNELQNINMDSSALQIMVFNFMDLIKSLIQYITAFTLLFALIWWYPFLLSITYVPFVIVNNHYVLYKYKWNRGSINNIRKRSFLLGLLSNKTVAYEERIYGFGETFIKKFMGLWNPWFEEKKKIFRRDFLANSVTAIIPEIIQILLLFFIVNNIISSTLSVGDYTLYSGLIAQVSGSMLIIGNLLSQIAENKSRVTLFDKFFKWENKIKEYGQIVPNSSLHICFKNVYFKYPNTDRYILKNITFDICPGEKVALVGLNGAGKSTIVKLLLRLYDVDKGEILVNGINIKEYDMNKWRKSFGVFFQDFFYYALTVKESISLEDEEKINMKKIYNSCIMSGLDSILNRLPKGVNTELTKIFDKENGVELSHGEKQKVALARAYYRDAPVLILDEPSSSLDAKAEKELFERIAEMSKDKTVLFISHRMSNAKLADKIIVIEDGKIIEEGSHSKLVLRNGKYAELFNIQAGRYMETS